MTAPATKYSLYGKLPAHGDFISRGMDRQRESAVDACLTQSLESARALWAPKFEETYLSAQPWLFSSEHGCAIIIPSVDKVGRVFPLFVTVAKEIVLQYLYDAVVGTISESGDADTLLEAVRSAPVLEKRSPDEPEGRWFCIDPIAPNLPRCWDEAKIDLGKA